MIAAALHRVVALRMLAFIDESGDPGMKLDGGSSSLFVVTLVAFNNDSDAISTDTRIQHLKHEMGFRSDFEFKFNKLDRRHRVEFLTGVSPFKWFYFSIVFNKRKLNGPGFRIKESFYKFACRLVFSNARKRLQNAIAVIDGSGNEEFRRQLSTYIKSKANESGAVPCIRKVKIQESHRNNLIQLADMVCGAVARSFSQKTDAKIYRQIVRPREIYVQFWPK
ncbi:MAG: DUF3800 domain-containing protein [Verrucomicrobiia bacterium]